MTEIASRGEVQSAAPRCAGRHALLLGFHHLWIAMEFSITDSGELYPERRRYIYPRRRPPSCARRRLASLVHSGLFPFIRPLSRRAGARRRSHGLEFFSAGLSVSDLSRALCIGERLGIVPAHQLFGRCRCWCTRIPYRASCVGTSHGTFVDRCYPGRALAAHLEVSGKSVLRSLSIRSPLLLQPVLSLQFLFVETYLVLHCCSLRC